LQRPLRFKPQRQPDVHPSFVAVEVPLPAFEFLAYMKSFFLLLPGKVKGAVGSPQAGSQVLKFAGQTHFQRQDVCFYCTFKTSCIKHFLGTTKFGKVRKKLVGTTPECSPHATRQLQQLFHLLFFQEILTQSKSYTSMSSFFESLGAPSNESSQIIGAMCLESGNQLLQDMQNLTSPFVDLNMTNPICDAPVLDNLLNMGFEAVQEVANARSHSEFCR